MKNRYITIGCVGLAILCASLFAQEPQKKEPQPEPPKAHASLRQYVESLVQREVVEPLKSKAKDESRIDLVSRARPSIRNSETYTSQMTSAAPGGILESESIVPFEVTRTTRGANPTTFLTGYYDAKSKSALLYDAVATKYVAIAEHPFIKARKDVKKSAS